MSSPIHAAAPGGTQRRIERFRQAATDLEAIGNVAATRIVREEIARLEQVQARKMREYLDAVSEATGSETDSDQEIHALRVALDHALTRWPGLTT